MADVLRVGTFAATVVALILVFCLSRKYYKQRGYFVAPTTWLLNLGAFLFVRLTGLEISHLVLNAWSMSIHLHVVLVVLGVCIALCVHKERLGGWRYDD